LDKLDLLYRLKEIKNQIDQYLEDFESKDTMSDIYLLRDVSLELKEILEEDRDWLFKLWLENKLGIELFEYRPERCVEVSRERILEYVAEAVKKDRCSIVSSGDTTVIWLGEFRELYIITRGRIFYTLSLTDEELKELRKNLGVDQDD